MRELLLAAEQEQDEGAEFTIDVFCYRARRYLGVYLAVVRGADVVVFEGAIGENAPEIRERMCRNMECCGLELSPAKIERRLDG